MLTSAHWPGLRALLLTTLLSTVGTSTGCAPDALTLRVDLVTDYEVSEIRDVGVTLDGAPAITSVDPEGHATARPIASFSPVMRGVHTVLVTLQGTDGTSLTRRVQVSVEANRVVTVTLSRSCLERRCPGAGEDSAATECASGRCVRPECVPEQPEGCEPSGQPRVDGGVPDASTADAPIDAPRDAPLDAPAGAPIDAPPPDAPGTCPVDDPCASRACGGHGACAVVGASASCACDYGYGGLDCTSCDVWMEADPGVCVPTLVPMLGTLSGDVLAGGAADDRTEGLDGNDDISGNNGGDLLLGGEGIDTLHGQGRGDLLYGGPGNDRLEGDDGEDALFGDDGDDVLIGGVNADRLTGGPGDDLLEGEQGDDHYVIDGLGSDIIDDMDRLGELRCIPGLFLVMETLSGGDLLISLSSGGSVRVVGNVIPRDRIHCCRAG